MTVELWYMAHPVGAAARAGVAVNLERAGRWLTWLRKVEPDKAILAPWLGTLLVGADDDFNPADRARGLRDNCVAAAAFGRIALVGGRISSGMGDELEAVLGVRGTISDLTPYGLEPPAPEIRILPGVVLRGGQHAWRRRESSRRTDWRRP